MFIVLAITVMLVGCGKEEYAKQQVALKYVEVIPPEEEHGMTFDNVIIWDDPKGTITYWEDFE